MFLAFHTAPSFAADIPLADRKSGYEFMGRETRAMQDDDTANPGMLWVLDGEALWNRKGGAAGKSCADCHGDARTSMKGVAARYPAYSAAARRPVDLAGRINICRTDQQKAAPLAFESKDLLSLATYIAHQSRGQPIAIKGRRRDTPVHRGGPKNLRAAPRPDQPLLRAMPRQQLGAEACRLATDAGASDRLSALSP